MLELDDSTKHAMQYANEMHFNGMLPNSFVRNVRPNQSNVHTQLHRLSDSMCQSAKLIYGMLQNTVYNYMAFGI